MMTFLHALATHWPKHTYSNISIARALLATVFVSMFTLCSAQSANTRTDSGDTLRITRENIPYFITIKDKSGLKKEVLDYSPKSDLDQYPLLEYKVDIGKISPIKVGNKIPEDILDLPFRIVNDEFGRDSITLRQLTTDKTLVMDFWASWCSPCLASMEKWEKLQISYSNEVQVIGFMLDYDYKAELMIAEKGWIIPQIVGPEAAFLNAYFCGIAVVGPSVWLKDNHFIGITKTTSDNESILKNISSGRINSIPKKEQFHITN